MADQDVRRKTENLGAGRNEPAVHDTRGITGDAKADRGLGTQGGASDDTGTARDANRGAGIGRVGENPADTDLTERADEEIYPGPSGQLEANRQGVGGGNVGVATGGGAPGADSSGSSGAIGSGGTTTAGGDAPVSRADCDNASD